jgi:hypothetical protein
MPELNLNIGGRNLGLVYEEGKEGFIELRDNDRDMSLHIRQEDFLIALHFVPNESDPVNQIDLDTGDVY